jgi:hypothetical protein
VRLKEKDPAKTYIIAYKGGNPQKKPSIFVIN